MNRGSREKERAVSDRTRSAASHFFCLALGLCLSALSLCADDFATRRNLFLNYYATAVPNTNQCCSGPHRIGRTGFWAAEGRFQTNDLVNGLTFVNFALADASAEDDNAGFSMWPGMDCFLRWNSVFSPALSNQFRAVFTTCTNYNAGVTYNQRMMLATARYLATGLWGTNAFPNNANAQADYGTGDPTGKAYLLNTILRSPRFGIYEHDSTIYEQYTLGPLRTLAEFAPDADVRNKARMAFDWIVAETAGSYFKCHWATASCRTFPTRTQTSYASTSATMMMTWLFFGGPQPNDFLESYPSALYCMTNFPGILPEVEMAGTNRTQPFTHRTTAVRNTGGFDNAYFKTSYITPRYALYSQAECAVVINGDSSLTITNYGTTSLSDPHQMQRWGVVWDDPNQQTKFWITNPHDPTYSYIGTTIYEDTVQHGGTLAGVYNIPTNALKPDWNHNGALSWQGVPSTNWQQLLGQIPASYTAVVNDSANTGRVFLHYTNVLIAFYISRNFTWTSGNTSFTVPANKLGLAVETASPDEYPQSTASARLAAFRNDVLTSSSVNTNLLTNTTPTLTYIDRHGNVLEITYGQGSKTNGQGVDYQQWPAIGNPWMYQPQAGNLFIVGTNRTVTYNFTNWTETTNNQPALTSVSNRTVHAGVALVITNTATDTDAPPQTLALALITSPTGASLATNTGVLLWRPKTSQADTTNLFTVRVADDGSPSLSATQSFFVTVPPLNKPVFSEPTITSGGLALLIQGDAGPDYTVQASTNLMAWEDVFTTNSPPLPFGWTDTNYPALQQRFYRLLLKP